MLRGLGAAALRRLAAAAAGHGLPLDSIRCERSVVVDHSGFNYPTTHCDTFGNLPQKGWGRFSLWEALSAVSQWIPFPTALRISVLQRHRFCSPFFLVAALKMVLPKKGSLFSRVTEQLRFSSSRKVSPRL